MRARAEINAQVEAKSRLGRLLLDDEEPAKYLACENAPMLQNMGRLAIREEAK